MDQKHVPEHKNSSSWSLQNARWDDLQADEDGLYVTDEEHQAMLLNQVRMASSIFARVYK